jgi:hypothetical protein
MAQRDPFAEALAGLAPPPDARATTEAVASTTSVWLPVAALALLVSVVLAVLSRLGVLPTVPAVAVAAVGYALTPGFVMVARVLVHVGVLRAQRSGASLGADVEKRLRRIHGLAVGSLLVAVPHVWVLAQVAGLWWHGR